MATILAATPEAHAARIATVIFETMTASDHSAALSFPANTHCRLVRSLYEWYTKYVHHRTAGALSAPQRRSCLQHFTEAGIGLLPLCAAHERAESEDAKRTLSLLWLCVRAMAHVAHVAHVAHLSSEDAATLEWHSPESNMMRRWMDGVLHQCDGVLDMPVTLLLPLPTHEDGDIIDALSILYFAQSRQQMMSALLQSDAMRTEEPQDAEWDHSEHAGAQALVEAADADLGVQVFRELISSFRLPRDALAPRRIIFYDRDTRRALERDHFQILSDAHSAASQTPSRVWARGVIPDFKASEETDTDTDGAARHEPKRNRQQLDLEETARRAAEERRQRMVSNVDSTLERMCAVLAGLFVNVVDSVDAARIMDAFMGKVDLPFLQVRHGRTPAAHVKLFASGGEWFAYSIAAGKLRTHAHGRGLKGLCDCACKLVADHLMRKDAHAH